MKNLKIKHKNINDYKKTEVALLIKARWGGRTPVSRTKVMTQRLPFYEAQDPADKVKKAVERLCL